MKSFQKHGLRWFGLVLVFIFFSSPAFGFWWFKSWQDRYAENNVDRLSNGQAGWQVLSPDYRDFHILDGLSLEWDYYSIHDDNGHFTGIIGYLVADPEGRLGGDFSWLVPDLMPSGGNLAINGRFKDNAGNYTVNANYINFGLGVDASADERYWYAQNPEGQWGKLEPYGGGMRLSGESQDYTWDLFISQAWGEGDSPNFHELKNATWEVGNDIEGFLPNEHWTVNPLWPTTYVTGTVTDKTRAETYNINGHGYRENSFGRWAFVAGGWDFWFMSDMNAKVSVGFQTYHYYTDDLDFMDLDFVDNGEAKTIRFYAKDGELGWKHDAWSWDVTSRQAVPKDVHIIADNGEYTADITATIVRMENGVEKLDYFPMLSDATVVTDKYIIQCLYPTYSGTIYRNADNSVVTTFSGIGGGEFSTARSIFDNFDPDAFEQMLGWIYSHPFPE